MAEVPGQAVHGVKVVGDALGANDIPVVMGYKDKSGNLKILYETASEGIPVDIVDASGISFSIPHAAVTDGQLAVVGDKGMIFAGLDSGGNYQFVLTDTSVRLECNVVIKDFNITSQTSDVKITLDSEIVETKPKAKVWDKGSLAIAKGAGPTTIMTSANPGKRAYSFRCNADGVFLFEIMVGVAGSEVTQFWARTSPSSPTDSGPIEIDIPTGQQLVIKATNEDNKSGNITAYAAINRDA
jgi:hypothetical protein